MRTTMETTEYCPNCGHRLVWVEMRKGANDWFDAFYECPNPNCEMRYDEFLDEL